MRSCSLSRRVLQSAAAVLLSIGSAGTVFAQAAAPPPPPAVAEPPEARQLRDELARLRQEFEAIRDAYGSRLAALEAKLGTATAAPAAGGAVTVAALPALPPVPPPAPATPAPAAPAAVAEAAPLAPPSQGGGAAGSLPVYGNASALSKIFNPDMAVIGNFLGATGRNPIDAAPALEMHEAEVSLQAIVDPYARADFFLAASPDGLEIEEGFLTLTSLPGGLLAKVGKLKEQFGKVNTLHAHSLPWVDTPLVMKNLLGGEEGIKDSGISVSKLIPNSLLFLEATGEVYQGTAGPFQSHDRSNVSWLGRVRGYRDITEGTNLDVGTSFTSGHNDAGLDTRTRLFGVDATVRYRPLRRAVYRRFLGRTELVWSRRGQSAGDVSAFGMYASGEYQFAQRWFGGLRYDHSQRAAAASLTDKGPSLVLTYWPSEFSQIRGQYRHIRYAENATSNELLFQFLFAIGAHGAHVF
ncbi:MAG: TonB-dependent receptor [Acidobacteriota bacterium]